MEGRGNVKRMRSVGLTASLQTWLRAVIGCVLGIAIAGSGVAAYGQVPAGRARLLVKPKDDNALTLSTTIIPGSSLRRTFSHVGNLQVIELPDGLAPQVAMVL